MKRFTKGCVIGGAVLLGIGLAVSAVGMFLGAVGDLRTADPAEAVPEEYTVQDVSQLELSLSSADVTVLPSPDGDLHISYSNTQHFQFVGELEQDAATGASVYTFIQTDIRAQHWWNLLEINFTSEAEDVTVYVPENLTLSVSTISGDVELENVPLEDCALTTVSGDVELENVTAGNCILSTTSGDLYWENTTLTGNLVLTTVSGDVGLDPATVFGNITVQSTSGDIFLNLVGAPPHQVDEISSLSGERFVYGCDDGGEYIISVTSTSGDIVVRDMQE